MNTLRQFKDRLVAKIMLMFPGLLHSWAEKGDFITHDESPFAPLNKPLSQCRVALVTTGGVHLRNQVPFDMIDPEGDPSFREIPATSEQKDLTITHNYYDHSDADKDINIVLPIMRLREMADTGEIESVNTRHFSFMGHIIGPHINTLVHETAPQVAAMLKDDQVDIVILTPT